MDELAYRQHWENYSRNKKTADALMSDLRSLYAGRDMTDVKIISRATIDQVITTSEGRLLREFYGEAQP